MDIVKQKKALRATVKCQVDELDFDYMMYSNKKICDAVIDLPEFKQAKTVFCFIGRNIEIDTIPIIENAIKNGKTVGIPKCAGKRKMDVREFTNMDDLELSQFDILEPRDDAKLISHDEIDFCLVPCMTCNDDGYRLGYGGGYYDTFIENCKAFTCLICRRKIMHSDIPLEPHDKRADMLITDDVAKRFV